MRRSMISPVSTGAVDTLQASRKSPSGFVYAPLDRANTIAVRGLHRNADKRSMKLGGVKFHLNHYVLNMGRAQGRLLHMRQQFGRVGVEFTRVEAVDARALNEQDVRELKAVFGADRNFAHIAISLSHMKVWELIASGDDEIAAIYEDDIHLSPHFKQIVQTEALFPPFADIVRLETTLQSMKLDRKPAVHLDDRSLFKVRAGAWGAAAYVMRRDTARWLTASPIRYRFAPDWMLYYAASPVARAINVLQMDPAPCVQDKYYPVMGNRLGFDAATPVPPMQPMLVKCRRAISPFARALRGRRTVSFG